MNQLKTSVAGLDCRYLYFNKDPPKWEKYFENVEVISDFMSGYLNSVHNSFQQAVFMIDSFIFTPRLWKTKQVSK